MVRTTPIVILDESTSQLDSVTESKIHEHLWDFFQNKTVLIITHRLSTLQGMDRILVFDNGRIVQDGTHQELLHRGGTYSALFKIGKLVSVS
jgi:ATP-binding cassette subfamily B protein